MSFLNRVFICALLANNVAFAQTVPPLMNYQGQLSDANGQALNGQRSLVFRVYDVPTGGTAIWGPQAITADVTNGYFNVVLSNDSTGGDSIATAFAGHPRYVSVSVNPVGQSTSAEILPRQQILSTPYAIRAATADHGALTGLADDDHPQYLLRSEINLSFLESISANLGIYDNRIAAISPALPYTEVCFKAGSVQTDVHPAAGPTIGGNCVPGDLGFVIEKNERPAALWTNARTACLLAGMWLPEPYEQHLSCLNATPFGLSDLSDDQEWASNQATPIGDSGYSGIVVPQIGGGAGGCTYGIAASVASFTQVSSSVPYRCAR